jgi:hypothetical protein
MIALEPIHRHTQKRLMRYENMAKILFSFFSSVKLENVGMSSKK